MRQMTDGKRAAPELLSPAGNRECFDAALAMGADAVYLAGKSFGARSYAGNFERGELAECVSAAHLRGKKIYAAVNTLIGDRELRELSEYLEFLEGAGVDAVITQDMSVPYLVRKRGLNLRLHASTQMTIHNLAGAKAAAELGFSRVVLARELSFDEIKYISENCGIETEIFVHGAMCMSYSGQCLMSSALGGRSGNRGKCAQPCRRTYKTDRGEKHVLSLKDMALISEIDKLYECGASSLKIEGRMKGPAYVAAVTSAYRRCLDERREPTKAELDVLDRIFFRGGQSAGYFDGKTGRDMFAFDKPDNPYKRGGAGIEKRVLDEAAERERGFNIPLSARLKFRVGEAPELTLISKDGSTASAKGGHDVQPARSAPMDAERLKAQLSKTGGGIFTIEDIVIDRDGRGFAPLSEINALRRDALDKIQKKILENYDKNNLQNPTLPPPPPPRNISETERGITADVTNAEQFRAVLEFEGESGNRAALIGVPIDELWRNTEAFAAECGRIMILPRAVMHKGEYEEYERRLDGLKKSGFSKLRVENISELGREGFELYGGPRLNVTNGVSAKFLKDLIGLKVVALSPELNLAQIRGIAENIPASVTVYGHQPLMLCENCVTKNLGPCPCGGGKHFLTDRFGKKFPIIRDGESCRSVVLNSLPTFMCDKIDELKKSGAALLNLSFTTESAADVKRALSACFGGGFKPAEFTRLHFNKGAITNKTDN